MGVSCCKVWAVRTLSGIAVASLLAIALPAGASPAYATVRDDLQKSYQTAVVEYEAAVGDQRENIAEIAAVEGRIETADRQIDQTEEELGDTATTLYKATRDGRVLADLLLDSESFQDAVMRYEKYEKISGYYREKAKELEEKRARLVEQKADLEARKAEIEQEVERARIAAEAAAIALLDNTHSDGAQFHQAQGVDNNCGATAFIVAVNTILHENRFTDNVAVWNGPGFNGDSTSDIAWRGGVWLAANGLSDLISVETVPGDIHTVQEMRGWLENGYVVVTSSGPGSTWQRADGTQAPDGSYPYGHYIMFYCYDNGVFYANDSAVASAQGAGCPYNEAQMQQWLDGRENHFAVVLKKR